MQETAEKFVICTALCLCLCIYHAMHKNRTPCWNTLDEVYRCINVPEEPSGCLHVAVTQSAKCNGQIYICRYIEGENQTKQYISYVQSFSSDSLLFIANIKCSDVLK